MIKASVRKKYLNKILNSKEFSGSKIYGAYLTYLVEAKAKGRELKETTIALEVFGKDSTFNPAEDTIVRSHTYNLRKKLETYYYSEGKDDEYRLDIPKGHYEVTFVRAPGSKSESKNGLITTVPKKYGLVLFLVILCIPMLLLWLRIQDLERALQQYQIVDESDPIWGDYLQSELPTLIVVGDHFFFTEATDRYENVLAIRDGKINSLEDLERLKAKYPKSDLQPAQEPYFPYHSIWSLPPILGLFFSTNQQPILRKSSSLSPQILDEYNIIFLGSIKTLYILKHTLVKSHFRFEISPHKVLYSASNPNTEKFFETSLHSPGPNDDLVLALKLPGPKQNCILIIASFHSLGAPEIANYLVTPAKRQNLENLFLERFGYFPKYFEVLFRVTGIDKTAYNTEVLVFNEVF